MNHQKYFLSWFCPFVVLVFFAVSCSQAADRSANVRMPVVSGQFYPGNAGELRSLVQTYLGRATAASDPDVRGLIVPHAGYPYSGPVAAEAYKSITGRAYDAVILIGFTHRTPFRGVYVDRHDAYETPIGQVPVDQSLAEAIRADNPLLNGGPAGEGLDEHSLEVQIPFLQTVLNPLKIVPIYMSRQDAESARILARAIAKAITGKNVLVVASTDLSHYHPYEEAVRMDRGFVALAEKGDISELAAATQSGQVEACGAGPVMALLMLVEEMGWERPKLLRYANSGDITGTRGQVVGYAAMAVDAKKDV